MHQQHSQLQTNNKDELSSHAVDHLGQEFLKRFRFLSSMQLFVFATVN